MLEIIQQLRELNNPPVIIIGGVFLIFIAFLIRKAYLNKHRYYDLIKQLSSIGIFLLFLLIFITNDFQMLELDTSYLKTAIYNKKIPNNNNLNNLTKKETFQTLNFNKLNKTLNISDGNIVNLSSLVKEYQAGKGLILNNNKFSLSDKNSAGTYGSKTKIPVVTVDTQGRITKIVEKKIDVVDTVLTEQQVDDYVSNNGYLLVEVDGDSTNELNTNFFLSGDSLTVSDQGGNLTVDLSPYIKNGESISELGDVDTVTTPPVNGQVLTWNATTNQWEAGSASAGNTDAQTISLNTATNILTLSNGTGPDTTVDLSQYLDNTDSQALSIVGHTISLVNGGSVTVPDNQQISRIGDTITLANGTGADTTVDLSPYITNTESIDELADVDTTTTAPTNNQVLAWDGSNWVPMSTSGLETVTNIANQIAGHKVADYTNEDGTVQNINETITNFTNLLGTGHQIATYNQEDGSTQNILETITSLALNTNSLDYTAEDGGTTNIDLSGYLDNTDDQNIQNLGLAGDILTVGIEDGTSQTVSLAQYALDTDLHNPVTLDTTNHDYLSLSGQQITLGQIDISDDTNLTVGTGLNLTGDTISLSASINNLIDVDTATNAPANNQVLAWDGTNWVPMSTSGLETVTNIANQIAGHKIADYTNEDGQVQDINETVTSLALNGNSLDYTDENGGTANVDLTNYSYNIYNHDDNLTGNRNVNLNGNNLVFSGSGRIGIGTTNPSHKLQINGNVRATRFHGADGTAGSPTFRFDSDTNTGMFRPASDNLAFTTGGNERVRITNFGQVGIGTSSPDMMLQVSGGAHIDKNLRVDDSEIIYSEHSYKDSSLGEELIWNLLQTQKTNDPNDKDFATITSGTGFKQTFPITRWKVGSEGDNGQHYGYVGYLPGLNKEFRINTGGDDRTSLVLGVNTKDVLYIDNDFNVGIGDWSAGDKLFVKGDMQLTGAFRDSNSQPGTAGQILSSTNTGTNWIDASALSLGSIDAHSDVDTTTNAPVNGDLLTWDGTNWVTTNSANYTNNIYTANGTLAGNRNVNLNGNNLMFTGSGRIGIGTTSPSEGQLVIRSGSSNGVRSLVFDEGNNDPNFWIESNFAGSGVGNYITMKDFYNHNIMTWKADGNIGIGNTAPTDKVHITGNIRVTGGYKDSSNDIGTAGQILSSTASGTDWINSSTVGTDNQDLTLTGNTLAISNDPNTDVDLSGYLDNTDTQTLSFNSATDILTISGGNTADLSSLEHTGTVGSIFFAGIDGKPTEDNANLFWDDTNNRLGLGTLTPDEQLHITQNMRLDHSFEDKDGDKGTMGQVLSSTVTGTDWIDNVSNPIPFISSIDDIPTATNHTFTYTIHGYNFTPNSAVSISGGNTINSVNILSPVEIEVNVTTSGTAGQYDVVISNNGILNTQWANNGVGKFIVSDSDGTTQARAGESCKAILDNGFSTGDGTYWIDPDGGSTSNAFQVYCDMTTDGGGWTKIEYAADLPHQNQFNGDPDTSRWLDNNFTLVLTDTQINNIRAVSTEGKQTYVGTCDGVIHYNFNGNYAYAFGFRYHDGHETAYEQQTYPSTNINVTADGCQTNNNSSTDTIFEIKDIRVPVINVHSRDNGPNELFGSPLTQNPAWLR